MSSRVLLGAAAYWDLLKQKRDASIERALASGVNSALDGGLRYGTPNCESEAGSAGTADRPFWQQKRMIARLTKHASQSLDHWSVCMWTYDLIQLHNLIEPKRMADGHGTGWRAWKRPSAREKKDWYASLEWQATAWLPRFSTLRRWNVSILIPCCCLTATWCGWINSTAVISWICLVFGQKRNVAVQTIKSLVHTPWASANTPETHGTVCSKCRRILTWRCIGCWGTRGCSWTRRRHPHFAASVGRRQPICFQAGGCCDAGDGWAVRNGITVLGIVNSIFYGKNPNSFLNFL